MTPDCLDENRILDYVEGRLAGGHVEAVESHLDSCAPCRLSAACMLNANQPIPRPATIDRYFVVRPIGAGASGVVYQAYDPQLDREVALKLLYIADLAGLTESEPSLRERLQRESRAMAKVVHANVVTIYDAGFFQDRMYIAMALLDGITLREWLNERLRTWQEIVRVFVAAGRGLCAVHAAGLLHRDFKPENVIVGEGAVWLTDFGLAKPMLSTTASAPGDLRSGVTGAAGTPAYMAPELIAGAAHTVRADVYSFSVALYEALSGELPQQGRVLSALSGIQSLTSRARAPQWLWQAVSRGLALSPDDRPADISGMLDELQVRPLRRRRRVVAAVAAVVLAGAIALGYALQPSCRNGDVLLRAIWGEPQRNALAAHLSSMPRGARTFDLASTAFDTFADGFRDAYTQSCEETLSGDASQQQLDLRMQCLRSNLADLQAKLRFVLLADAATVDEIVVVTSKLPFAPDCLSSTTLNAPLPRDVEQRAQIDAAYQSLAEGRVLNDASQKSKARNVLTPLLQTAETLGYAPLSARVRVEYALTFLWGDPTQSLQPLMAAVRDAEVGRDDRTRARALLWYANVQSYLGKRTEAAEAVRNAEAILRRVEGDLELQAFMEVTLSKIAQGRQEFADATRHAQRALELEEQRPASSLASQSMYLTALCTMRTEVNGDAAAALEVCSLAAKTVEQLYGPEHWRLIPITGGLASANDFLGKHETALVLRERALALAATAFGSDNAFLTPLLMGHGLTLLNLNRVSEALVDFQRASGLIRQKYGDAHPEQVEAMHLQARALISLGRAREALRLLRRAKLLVQSPDMGANIVADNALLMVKALLACGEDTRDERQRLADAHAWFARHPDWYAKELAEMTPWLQ